VKLEVCGNEDTDISGGGCNSHSAPMQSAVFNVPCQLWAAEVGQADERFACGVGAALTKPKLMHRMAATSGGSVKSPAGQEKPTVS